MREFQEKKKYRKILYSKGMVVVLIFLILFFARATWGVYKKQRETAANAARAQTELVKLQNREQMLNSEITRLNTNEGVEEEIRSKFGVSKPGEQMVIIVDSKATTTEEVIQEDTWWTKFKNIFN